VLAEEEVREHLRTGRPGARLDVSKLLALFPDELNDVHTATEEVGTTHEWEYESVRIRVCTCVMCLYVLVCLS
jgi:hypothetical protein